MSQDPFSFPEPYRVDPRDKHTLGRLRYAAHRGDARARLTLRELTADRATNTAAEPPGDTSSRDPNRTVKSGRTMYENRQRDRAQTRHDGPSA
ncbi:hypothetical protein [Ornithinicoccus halotolerans]|uniref:hypothetical protein n=1 Tax=Ornithinicoccus halotolerans TaxID=1748220 RepID=UPI001297C75E|nr:hypothetical protein [Ornithinicoccus halotolerans]